MRAALILVALAPVWAQTTAGPVTQVVTGGTVKVSGGTTVVSSGTSVVSGGTTVIGGGGGTAPSTYTFVTYTFLQETATANTSITSPALTLTAGDFVIWFCRAAGSATVTVSSTPTNTVANLPQGTWPTGNSFMFAYILSAVAGSTTFTCSYATAASFTSMVVLEYHHSGAAAAFDTQNQGSRSGTTATSNAFNTAGSPGLVIQCATWAAQATVTAGTIGGTAAALRGVSAATLASTAADSGCQDATFMTPQTGITATISTATANSGYSVGVFK